MISVILAAYNEEAIIEESIFSIVKTCKADISGLWELIVVDDGSTDDTGQILDGLVERIPELRISHHRTNLGQGRALKTAFAIAEGQIFVTLDADLSYSPDHISIFLEKIEKGADVVLASAYMKGGKVQNVPIHRRFLSRWGNRYLKKMSLYNISTSTCVVRAYKRKVIDEIVLTTDGMEMQIEILLKAAILNFTVIEVPAKLIWRDQKKHRSGVGRASKMRILKTISIYLKLGWLSRPAYVLIALSLITLIPVFVIFISLVKRLTETLPLYIDQGFAIAFSKSFAEIFHTYPGSFIVAGILAALSVQLLTFSLLLIVNRFYFEEIYRQMNYLHNKQSQNQIEKP